MGVLQQIDDQARGPLFQLAAACTLIGRDDQCDLMIPSPAVSRVHARIVREDSRYFLEDLQSRNGTTLNGRRIASRELLRDGDQIDFSTRQYVFYSQLALDEQTGSWGGAGGALQVAPAGRGDDSDTSIRRAMIQAGHTIPQETSQRGDLRDARVVSRVAAAGVHLSLLASHDATRKLYQAMLLLESLRTTRRSAELLSVVLEKLFVFFPTVERIAIVGSATDATGYRVLAASGRQPDDAVQLCCPLIRECQQACEAILYVDQWRESDVSQPRLADLSVRYLMCVPLTCDDQTCFGAIQLESSRTERPLETVDVERLVILAQYIACAFEKVASTEQVNPCVNNGDSPTMVVEPDVSPDSASTSQENT